MVGGGDSSSEDDEDTSRKLVIRHPPSNRVVKATAVAPIPDLQEVKEPMEEPRTHASVDLSSCLLN
jgi:hypothetical protein